MYSASALMSFKNLADKNQGILVFLSVKTQQGCNELRSPMARMKKDFPECPLSNHTGARHILVCQETFCLLHRLLEVAILSFLCHEHQILLLLRRGHFAEEHYKLPLRSQSRYRSAVRYCTRLRKCGLHG